MISINDLTVSFGGYTLLDSINFHISDRDRIGLVGKNGAGKSTILKLIVGLENPTSGKVLKPSGVNIGYLPQIMEHSRDKTVLEETMTAFAELNALNARIDAISAELARRTDYESDAYHRLIVEMNDINDRIGYYGSESPQSLAEKTLAGLGFKRSELDRPAATFSQGWNMRIELAKILLRRPDVLLLDVPTNHLDIESIQWLEDYLTGFGGTLVLISHDRKFLDTCTDRTVEIMLGHIYDYKVPYSEYVELRRERIAQQKAAYENQQRMIGKTEDFIERFRYKPTKSNQVQSRIKQLDRLERIEIDQEDNSTLCVKFPPAPRSGDVAFEARDVKVGYPLHPGSDAEDERVEGDHKVILRSANVIVRRGEKVAFVGRNGEGKTTMMRVLSGELGILAGEARVGHNVSIGYYAQNQEDVLDKSLTVYDTLENVAVGDVRMRLRDILGAFLFKGNDIDKKVAVLSGGERSRLAMARLMLEPYNLLALDEPTNHMDIRSKDVLKQALKSYDGTVIVVSHDRDFLEGLVDKLYEFRDGGVREHLGGVEDFLHRKKIESFRELEAAAAVRQQEKTPAKPKAATESYRSQQEARKLEAKRNSLEKKIAALEEKMKGIEELLSNPTADTDIMQLTRDYLELKRDLDEKMEQWASI